MLLVSNKVKGSDLCFLDAIIAPDETKQLLYVVSQGIPKRHYLTDAEQHGVLFVNQKFFILQLINFFNHSSLLSL